MARTISRLLLLFVLIAFAASSIDASGASASAPNAGGRGPAARRSSADGKDVRAIAEEEGEGPAAADTVYWVPEIVVEAERLRAPDRLLDLSLIHI